MIAYLALMIYFDAKNIDLSINLSSSLTSKFIILSTAFLALNYLFEFDSKKLTIPLKIIGQMTFFRYNLAFLKF